jgi:hypothetical protein
MTRAGQWPHGRIQARSGHGVIPEVLAVALVLPIGKKIPKIAATVAGDLRATGDATDSGPAAFH